jgi:AraC-like DNA-binding protein
MAFVGNPDKEFRLPVRVALINNYSFLAHWHNEIEMLLVLDGHMKVGINSETRNLNSGDLAICRSGDIHFYDGLDSQCRGLVIAFAPQVIEEMISIPDNSRLLTPFIDQATVSKAGLNPAAIEAIRQTMQKLHSEMDRKDNHYQVFVLSLLHELIGLALRHLPVNSNAGVRSESAAARKLTQKAIKYVESNYALSISLDKVAKHLGITEVYFSRVFIKVTGLNFKTYLNKLRIEKAKNMILYSDDPIVEIASKCGFGSIRTFNRVFKAEKGIAPTQLR